MSKLTLEAEHITAETLMAPGGIENLVASDRIPWFIKLFESDTDMALIPPDGTQRGDSVRRTGFGIGTEEFFAPDGTSRGRVLKIMFPASEYLDFEARLKAAMAPQE